MENEDGNDEPQQAQSRYSVLRSRGLFGSFRLGRLCVRGVLYGIERKLRGQEGDLLRGWVLLEGGGCWLILGLEGRGKGEAEEDGKGGGRVYDGREGL